MSLHPNSSSSYNTLSFILYTCYKTDLSLDFYTMVDSQSICSPRLWGNLSSASFVLCFETKISAMHVSCKHFVTGVWKLLWMSAYPLPTHFKVQNLGEEMNDVKMWRAMRWPSGNMKDTGNYLGIIWNKIANYLVCYVTCVVNTTLTSGDTAATLFRTWNGIHFNEKTRRWGSPCGYFKTKLRVSEPIKH